MYKFYGYPKCTTCKRAWKLLEEAGVSAEYIDIKENPPSQLMIEKWLNEENFPKKKFFNTSGLSYRTLNLKEKVEHLNYNEAASLLASDGMLIKRPLLVKNGELVAIGLKEQEWSNLL
ncbi:arsenate reductase [Pilibacter termitis]|uniref:Arsenate reductase n=1 Tax=Pilibacter termitis TaxID=263852 RepID=A0A1T4LLB9_9ENTE|nr:arsenate reductase family protein [Pilibacter termitis]SJZ55451.1 arsenate reductase [Pilibacter termitis]